jgi:hypothetical protein
MLKAGALLALIIVSVSILYLAIPGFFSLP